MQTLIHHKTKRLLVLHHDFCEGMAFGVGNLQSCAGLRCGGARHEHAAHRDITGSHRGGSSGARAYPPRREALTVGGRQVLHSSHALWVLSSTWAHSNCIDNACKPAHATDTLKHTTYLLIHQIKPNRYALGMLAQAPIEAAFFAFYGRGHPLRWRRAHARGVHY